PRNLLQDEVCTFALRGQCLFLPLGKSVGSAQKLKIVSKVRFIKGYFKKALAALEAHDSDVETDFIEATKLAYVCRIYVRGRTWKQCRIWLSGRMSSDQIYYYEGNVDIAGDSAFNEYISVEDDGYTLFLRLSNMRFSSPQQQETQVGKEKAAEDLWKRLTQSLKI